MLPCQTCIQPEPPCWRYDQAVSYIADVERALTAGLRLDYGSLVNYDNDRKQIDRCDELRRR